MSKIQCLECGKVLESKHTHDWRSCGCKNSTFIDGGNDYLRCGGFSLEPILVLEECGVFKNHPKVIGGEV